MFMLKRLKPLVHKGQICLKILVKQQINCIIRFCLFKKVVFQSVVIIYVKKHLLECSVLFKSKCTFDWHCYFYGILMIFGGGG